MHVEFIKYREALPAVVTLPQLEYTYEEVSHVMIPEMLDLHYTKLHQGYIDRYNKAQATLKMTELVSEPKTEDEKALLFNLGGYLNHCLFWKSFNPKESTHNPSDKLSFLISKSFPKGLFQEIVEILPKIRGSGWIWLCYSKETELLNLEITMNQDFPLSAVLLNIDLWEHSYMQQYKIDKVQYLTAIFSVLNWESASNRLEEILNE